MSASIDIEARPPLGRGLIWGLQHVLVMLAGMIAVPLAVGTALALPNDEQVLLVQGAIVTSGIGTVLQSLGIGFIGARLPIVMGSAFVFIAPMISIGEQLNIQAIMGAIIVGGIAEFALSFVVWRVRRFFPPMVTGTVITIIGLGLLPLGFSWAVGAGTEQFGDPVTFALSGLVLLVLILLNLQSHPLVRSAAILIGIVIGYVASSAVGILDLSSVGEAGWFALPQPFAFGRPVFHIGAILAILIAQFASMLETIGDTVAIKGMNNSEVQPADLRGAISVDGLASTFAPVLNGLSLTSFSQNLGVISLTGVGSRFVVALGGVLLILFGLLPKLAAVITSMPLPVLGGAAIAMFGAVAATGVNQLRAVEMSQRNVLIFAIAVGLGVGVTTAPPGTFEALPTGLRILLESSVAVGGAAAMLLDRILPR